MALHVTLACDVTKSETWVNICDSLYSAQKLLAQSGSVKSSTKGQSVQCDSVLWRDTAHSQQCPVRLQSY